VRKVISGKANRPKRAINLAADVVEWMVGVMRESIGDEKRYMKSEWRLFHGSFTGSYQLGV